MPFKQVRKNVHIIQRFGMAELFKSEGGSHELVGGTREDRAAAQDWASLVAHEVVFSHPGLRADQLRGAGKPAGGKITLRFHTSKSG